MPALVSCSVHYIEYGVHYFEYLDRGFVGGLGEGKQQTRCHGDVNVDQTDGLSRAVSGGQAGTCIIQMSLHGHMTSHDHHMIIT